MRCFITLLQRIWLGRATIIFATAKEFFENGGGDCEDYAVAKAALILGLDIAQPDEVELWVLYKVPESLHAVLAVKAGDNEYFVLDNANDSIERVKKYSIYRGYILLESYSYSRGVPQNPQLNANGNFYSEKTNQ